MAEDEIVISNSLYMALLDVNTRHNILIDYIFDKTELSRYRKNELEDVWIDSKFLKAIEPIEYAKKRCELIHRELKNQSKSKEKR
jgi:hypothetical protein